MSLCVIVSMLCCSSYYFCCICIWFISEDSKIESFGKESPAGLLSNLSPLVFDMRRLSSRNAAVFLLVSLLLSVAIMAYIVIRGDVTGDGWVTFTLLSIFAVGYVTFAVLFVCSKIFIGRLAAQW